MWAPASSAQEPPSSTPTTTTAPPAPPPRTGGSLPVTGAPAPSSEAATAEPSSGSTPQTETPPPTAAPPAPRTAPYSLPFQLRPVTAGTVARSDTSFASYENKLSQGGFAVVSGLTGSYRIPGTGDKPGTGLAPLVKLTVVNDSPPAGATGGFAFVNPLVGAMYSLSFGAGLRAAASLGVTIPVGMGGGDTPDKGQLDARTVGPFARASMDNSLFAVDDLAVIPGLDFAYIGGGFTAQIEATLFQLERVRGGPENPPPASGYKPQLEASKTNLTCGIHVGYFLLAGLSLGAELRYQRWLNAPIAVDKSLPGTSVDQLSFAVGPRLHLKLGEKIWIRPGVSYTRGFDPPMTSPGNYNNVQLDVPVVF